MMAGLQIGLTGGIGSGKSTVATLLVELGATLVDTDAIAHELTRPNGAAMPAIAAEFGADMVGADGALERSRMRALAFAEPGAKLRLERILHPLIGAQAQAQALRAGSNTVVFDVPLLAESRHWRQRVQRILVVDCAAATQVQRVMQRSGWTQEAVQRVVALQASRSRRRAVADAVLFNDGISPATLREQAAALWLHWHARH